MFSVLFNERHDLIVVQFLLFFLQVISFTFC